ncbi:MAG: exosortase/archaeosortase family protein [Paludibacteraceae bacterium]|nr:exosortase/archaeosortase family protein [Paludibacteraceae bacterium]MBQ2065548.1 exosortase/archaeosortase family protein [Paludibacteraceae bacterium]MBQ5524211.1 exosortase/archaeosortase family protein [Paludibacteraceae bacterium]
MKDIIKSLASTAYFIAVLLIVHFVWRAGFNEGHDLSGNELVTFYGRDVTSFFAVISGWLTQAVYGVLDTCTSVEAELRRSAVYLVSQDTPIKIVWNCTGVKQIGFFCLLILCYPRHTWHKLWFIPAGIAVLFAVNILRITGIIYFCDADIARFDSLHETSKYLYYGIIFLIWILWDWKIAAPAKR